MRPSVTLKNRVRHVPRAGVATGGVVLMLAIVAPALNAQSVELLQEYLRVDTTNPPGNESRAVEFFARILEAEGISYETAESAPGRGNIWARLEGGS
ncbi:MAG: hypothetical protein V3S91_07365, partial [Gemmatimonadota bacterium]